MAAQQTAVRASSSFNTLPLLLLAALATATPAVAESTLQVAGELNLSLAHYRGHQEAGGLHTQTRLDSYGSRLTLRGTEALGGSLKASFTLASSLGPDDGRGRFCSRDCWVALSGDFGMLKLGRLLPIYDDVSVPWYFIETPGTHNPLALWANCGGGAGLESGCLDNYLPGSLRYDTPRVSGWSASASASRVEDVPEPGRAAKVYTLGGDYRDAGWYMGYAAQIQDDARGAGLRDTGFTVSLLYKGPLTLGLGYEHLRYKMAGGETLRRDYLGLLLARYTGPHATWFNLGRAGSGHGDAARGATVNAVSQLPRSGAWMWSVGQHYKISPTVKLYGFYTEIRNEPHGAYALDAASAKWLGRGRRLSTWALGYIVRF
ncbi:porin [Caldimonas brevitalea]|uniref:porin n=1 Tax=Caldimonas brevitalea TaxID=413882 RepID=UPI00147040FC|nr:porin [Caldimonas brevitalea]